MFKGINFGLKKMAEFLYNLVTKAVRNTNITINIGGEPITHHHTKPWPEQDTPTTIPTTIPTTTPTTEPGPTSSGAQQLSKDDLIQLVSDLERVCNTLKRMNVKYMGTKQTEIFFMLENFDKILNSVKLVLNAC